MALSMLLGALGGSSCGMTSAGGLFVCACLLAVLRITVAADRAAGTIESGVLMIVGFVARVLGLEPGVTQALLGKINVIMHVLRTSFVINICAAMICAMARFLQYATCQTQNAPVITLARELEGVLDQGSLL